MPRSRSESTKTGVCNCSARSKASPAKLEALLHRRRKQHARACVSPCESRAINEQVALRGARRQSGRRPDALNVEDHARQSPRSSPARQTPPSAKCPARRWPSSSARPPSPRPAPCRWRPVRPPPARSRRSPCRPAPRDIPSCSRSAFSTTDDDGVIGYQVTTVTPANIAPIAAAAVAVDDDLARGRVHAARRETDPAWSANSAA